MIKNIINKGVKGVKMANLNMLCMLTNSKYVLAYIEKVKKEYYEKLGIKLNLQKIKEYMLKFISKIGGSDLHIKLVLNILCDYYDENGKLKCFCD